VVVVPRLAVTYQTLLPGFSQITTTRLGELEQLSLSAGGDVMQQFHHETTPPFCTVVHFVYILMDPDPT
jgi:hypothetical protein